MVNSPLSMVSGQWSIGKNQGALVSLRRIVPLLLAALLVTLGCRPAAPETPLQAVPLPSLEGMADTAQEQIRTHHARTLAAADSLGDTALGQAYGRLGQLLFTYDFLDAAEPALRNAETLNPEDERWPYYLGILYRQRGDFGKADSTFETIVTHRPEDVLARLRWAEISLEQGHPEGAQRQLETVIEADPENALAHFLLGQLAYEAEAFETAVAHYERVLVLQPAATQIHTPLALAYRNLGNQQQSRYHLERRGSTPVQLPDPRVQALEAFKQTSGATALNQGMALLDAGQYAEAVAALEVALAQDPTNASNHLNLGVARAQGGDHAGAIQAFEEALRLDPTKSKAHYNLGAIYAAAGDTVLAEERFRAAIGADPRSGEAHLELAELLRRAGRCEDALPHFQDALAIMPGDIAARQHQAFCHLRLNQYAAARTLLEDGLAANPEHLGFVDGLARILATSPGASAEDGARALHLAEQALSLQRRPETLETLAMAYARRGRYEEAIARQEEVIRMAEQRGHAAYLAHLRDNLQRYRQQTPSRTPWPAFMYEQ